MSHTTRAPRPAEQDGVDYYFVDRAHFEALRDRGGFAEWAEVHGNLYGTSRAEIARLHQGGKVALFDIDIVGAHNLWRLYPDEVRLAFLLPPTWQVLVDRLLKRGTDSEVVVRRRLRTARLELHGVCASPAPWHIVVNDALDVAAAQLEGLLVSPPPPAEDPRAHPSVQAFLHDADADPRAA